MIIVNQKDLARMTKPKLIAVIEEHYRELEEEHETAGGMTGNRALELNGQIVESCCTNWDTTRGLDNQLPHPAIRCRLEALPPSRRGLPGSRVLFVPAIIPRLCVLGVLWGGKKKG